MVTGYYLIRTASSERYLHTKQGKQLTVTATKTDGK